jgi:prepilin-type N-terminal cleavage/methylation domain-containing protein
MVKKKVAQKKGFLLIEVSIALVILLIGFSSVWQLVGYLATYSQSTAVQYDLLSENKTIDQYQVNAIAEFVNYQLTSSIDHE